MFDHHTHIGLYYKTYYDFHDVFLALKNNGVAQTTTAYLTPRFNDEKNALDFFYAVQEELKEAKAFAEKIGLKVNFLYWADPLVLKNIKLEKIWGIKEMVVSRASTTAGSGTTTAKYFGIALHPIIHAWTKDFPEILTDIFRFAQNQNIPIFLHTGVSENDEPLQFEKWFSAFPEVKVRLAHCKDSKAIIKLFTKYENLTGDTAFCPKDSLDAICRAGFENRMFFGTDFPITHWFEHRDEENILADEKILTESYAKTVKKGKSSQKIISFFD